MPFSDLAIHKKPTRSSTVFENSHLLFAVSTLEAGLAKGVVLRENGEILYLAITDAAAICTIIANECPVVEKEEVCIRDEDGTAGVAAETVYICHREVTMVLVAYSKAPLSI